MWLEILLFLLLLCVLDYLWKRDLNTKLAKLHGPLNIPIIGSMWIYFHVKPDDLLAMSRDMRQRYGRTFKFWILHIPAVFTSDMKCIQDLLSNTVEINKNRMYTLLTAWLGNGLLLSNGQKWLGRRRVITPTFHFSILEEFVKIFDQQSQIIVTKLNQHSDGQHAIDVHDHVALATLDVICKTAMGVRINAQTDENCEYVCLLTKMTSIVIKRFVNMPYRLNFLFKLLAPKLAREHKYVMNAMHAFTERIIMERRQEILKNKNSKNESNAYMDGKPLSNQDIREEVDTFMFEGHDTTKSGIGFTLYSISREPEVQQKLYEEIKQVIGTDAQQELSYRELMDLKYTEKVIKEALRMYPLVPFIGRNIMRDCKLNNSCIPKGTSVLLAIISMQNDPEYFPEPQRFLPERAANENAFGFVPFSAGLRNCIGQRFAMLEMKAFVARIVQSYELLPLGDAMEPTVCIVLKSKTVWQMGFRKRHSNNFNYICK